MLIQLSMKPKKPEDVGESLKSNLREYCIKCMYNCYNKIQNSPTLSCSLPRKIVTNNKNLLKFRLSFEDKITDVVDFYELKTRMCAKGSKMIEGQDYEISNSSTADEESLRFMIAIASE